MRSKNDCTCSPDSIGRVTRDEVRRAVRDLTSLDTRLADLAAGLDPGEEPEDFRSMRGGLAAEMGRGIQAVRHDLLADALETLERLAELQTEDVERRRAEEAELVERLHEAV